MKSVTALEQWLKDLQEAQVFVDGLETSERLRKTLRRSIAESMVEAEDRSLDSYERRNSTERWTQGDAEALREELVLVEDPNSWGEEEARMHELTTKFGRSRKFLKKKAAELGLYKKVDYWSNRKSD